MMDVMELLEVMHKSSEEERLIKHEGRGQERMMVSQESAKSE